MPSARVVEALDEIEHGKDGLGPVAEAPLDFTRRAAPRVRHVHLKDYRVQFTDEGYRLVRCAIGDGAVPIAEIAAILGQHHQHMTAVLEPGALEARHVRLLTPEWWNGYKPKSATEMVGLFQAAFSGLQVRDDAFELQGALRYPVV